MKQKNAIFVITSPLQALCALEAYEHYKIDKCIFYILDDGRVNQVVKYLKDKNFDYIIYDKKITFISLLKCLIYYFLPFEKKNYDFLFLGNVYMLKQILLFLPNLRRKARIVYLDDGNNILGYVNKKLPLSRQVLTNIICIFTFVKQIKINIIFSIFADELKTTKYSIEKNSLNILKSKKQKCGDYVYIIGTYIDDFCIDFNISRSVFLKKLKVLFSLIQYRYPQKKIIYVPHGREPLNNDLIQLCSDSGVEFLKLDECIEIYLTKLERTPVAILGFGSTALFSLRKIYSKIPIINVFLNDSKMVLDDYRVVYETYLNVNIEMLKI